MNENTIQRQILEFLERHPKVAWAQRINSGASKRNGTYVRFGFVGCPDILGQLKDGRALGVEIKSDVMGSQSSKPTVAQSTHIALMLKHNGIAGVVRSIADVEALLK